MKLRSNTVLRWFEVKCEMHFELTRTCECDFG